MIILRQRAFSAEPEQRDYSLKSFVNTLGLSTDYINRKIR